MFFLSDDYMCLRGEYSTAQRPERTGMYMPGASSRSVHADDQLLPSGTGRKWAGAVVIHYSGKAVKVPLRIAERQKRRSRR